MSIDLPPELVSKRIALLTDFAERLRDWERLEKDLRFKTTAFAASGAPPQRPKDAEAQAAARSFLNRNMLAVHAAIADAGLPTVLTHWEAPQLGGRRTTVDLFSVNLLNGIRKDSP